MNDWLKKNILTVVLLLVNCIVIYQLYLTKQTLKSATKVIELTNQKLDYIDSDVNAEFKQIRSLINSEIELEEFTNQKLDYIESDINRPKYSK